MTTGLLVVAAVLVLGTGLGLWRRHTDGRFHSPRAPLTPSTATIPRPAAATVGPAATVGGPVTAPAARMASAPDVPDHRARPTTDLIGTSEAGTLPITGLGPADRPIAEPAQAAPETLDRELMAALGVGPAQATLLQFSSAFCAPCRALRRVSSEVAAMLPGVEHVEVDAESHLDAVRALNIWRTPTLLVLDAEGRVIKRATGVPGKPQLIAVLGEILPETRPDQR